MRNKSLFTIEWLAQKKAEGKISGYSSVDIKSEKKKRRSKFNNNAVEYEGIKFDSNKECRRYKELLMLLKAGEIVQLKLQKPYILIDANENEKKCIYVADFEYYTKDGELVVEDTKSDITRKHPVYIMKRKLMLDRHGIKIKET